MADGLGGVKDVVIASLREWMMWQRCENLGQVICRQLYSKGTVTAR